MSQGEPKENKRKRKRGEEKGKEKRGGRKKRAHEGLTARTWPSTCLRRRRKGERRNETSFGGAYNVPFYLRNFVVVRLYTGGGLCTCLLVVTTLAAASYP